MNPYPLNCVNIGEKRKRNILCLPRPTPLTVSVVLILVSMFSNILCFWLSKMLGMWTPREGFSRNKCFRPEKCTSHFSRLFVNCFTFVKLFFVLYNNAFVIRSFTHKEPDWQLPTIHITKDLMYIVSNESSIHFQQSYYVYVTFGEWFLLKYEISFFNVTERWVN